MITQAQQILPLYGQGPIPNSRPVKDEEKKEAGKDPGQISLSLVSRPTLTVFLPPKDKANGTAIIICPGGSYIHLSMSHEGYEVAEKCNEMGIIAFVLKYRLPSDVTMINKAIGPLQDAQQAIQPPPTFLVHAEDDRTVPVRNTLHFYEALQRSGVPAELHVYPKGGHGYGLHNSTTKDQWIDRLENWLDANGWLSKSR